MQNYTLSDAQNLTINIEFKTRGNWVNKDGVTNETIKQDVFELVKLLDVTGTVYNRNTTQSSPEERVGWPVLQENFTEVLTLNSHQNWEFRLSLEDLILSGTPSTVELIDYYYTNYQISVNKNKIYREMYFRCLSSSACAGLMPSKETMINANYAAIYANPRYTDAVKQQLGDYLQFIHELVPEDVRVYKYYHEYATSTKTTPVPPSVANGGLMTITSTGDQTPTMVMAGGKPVMTPGFVTTKSESAMGADAAFTAEWKKLSDELVAEIDAMQTNFAISVNLYDHVEDYQDSDLLYPYRERKTHIGSYPIDTVDQKYASEDLYLKKAELCEEEKVFTKPALFQRFKGALGNLSGGKDKAKVSAVQSIKEGCGGRKLQYDRHETGIGGTDTNTGTTYTVLDVNVYLGPTVSTMLLNRNKSGEDLFDALTRIGGLFAFFFLVLRPFASRLNNKLYLGTLVKELFIFKEAETRGSGLNSKDDIDPKEFDRSFKESSFYPDLPVIENSFITVQNNPSNTLPGVNGQGKLPDNNMDGGANEMQELQRIQNSLLKASKPVVAPIASNYDNTKFHLVVPGCCSHHDQSKAATQLANSPSARASPVGAAGEMPYGSVGPAGAPADKVEDLQFDTGRELIDPN